MGDDGEYVDERFFRPVSRSDYGPEASTASIKYRSRGRGIFASGIYITEFRWREEEGRVQIISRADMIAVYRQVKRAEEEWKAASVDIRPLLLYRIFGMDDPVYREADTLRSEYSARLRGLISHLVQTCAEIAALERDSDTSITWTHYPPPQILHLGRYDPPTAIRGRTTYPFYLVVEAQRFINAPQPPIELEIGREMGRICTPAGTKPVFKLWVPAAEMSVAPMKTEEEESWRSDAEGWRGSLRDILRRRDVAQSGQLPEYDAQLPAYEA